MLGSLYVDSDWRPALTAVMNAEKNSVQALKEVEKLAILSLAPPVPTAQLIAAETKLAENLVELKQRNRLHGPLPSVNELLNPEIEIVEDEELEMPMDEEIVAKVQHDLVVEQGDIIVIDDDDDEEEEEAKRSLILRRPRGLYSSKSSRRS
ncbi:hypothetical protein B0H14DRAFT_2651027 [Mycena olivaceomarginata]|nr:hypothetical protein B0H14DRAFT_2651027 [Mycena olivaceomarginata]